MEFWRGGLELYCNECSVSFIDKVTFTQAWLTYIALTGLMCVYGVTGPVTSVSFSMDGNCVLVSSLDSTLRLLDKEAGEMLNR